MGLLKRTGAARTGSRSWDLVWGWNVDIPRQWKIRPPCVAASSTNLEVSVLPQGRGNCWYRILVAGGCFRWVHLIFLVRWYSGSLARTGTSNKGMEDAAAPKATSQPVVFLLWDETSECCGLPGEIMLSAKPSRW